MRTNNPTFPVSGCMAWMLLVLLSASCTEGKPEKEKPNFLFILADDLGACDLSCTGSRFYETPNIDRISNEGMTFTQGYAACQVCSPSRASILTGQFPARHGITDWIGAPAGEEWRKAGRFNQLLPPDYKHNLDHSHTTLAEAMKQGGYKTFFAGKWHLGSKGSWPTDHGFDINKGGWDVGSPRGGFFSPFENPNLENREVGENLSMRLANETVQFLEEHKDTAFFAYLSFYAVHAPLQCTREKWAKYRAKAEEMGIAESGFEMGHFLPIRQVQDHPVYAGLVEAMDDAVGHVLNALKELGLENNTIVIFTSDNGGVVAGDAFATSNLPLRGGKGYQFEGGIREPYFIKVPGLTRGGERCDAPVSGTDFFPTLLDLAGLDPLPNQHLDGVSLFPLLKGESMEDRSLVWHYPHYGNQGGEPSSILRKGSWKLIHYYEDGREELYNLERDLAENSNVALSNPDRVKQMREELFAFLQETGARFPEPDPQYNASLEQEYLKQVLEIRWSQLEKQRLDFLSEDFDPGNHWWGSAK